MAVLPVRHLFLLILLFLFNSLLSFFSVMLFSSTFFCSVRFISHLCCFLFSTGLFNPFVSFIFSSVLYIKPRSSLIFSNSHPLCSYPLLTHILLPSSLFPLLVVPVNGHVDLKTSLTPPLITHTAATPMPVPKLPVGGDPILGYESRRGSNVSIDPACYDKSPVSAFSFLTYTKSMWQFLSVIPLFQDVTKPTLIHM